MALAAVLTVPTTRPAPVIALVAAACVRPTTFGTATGAGPLETTRFTGDPALTCVPAAGFSLITLPDGTVALAAVATVPTTRPAPVMALVAAAACVQTHHIGNRNLRRTARYYQVTADPLLTCVPATEFSLITLPEGTVALEAVVTVPTIRPAPVIALVAAACVQTQSKTLSTAITQPPG